MHVVNRGIESAEFTYLAYSGHSRASKRGVMKKTNGRLMVFGKDELFYTEININRDE